MLAQWANTEESSVLTIYIFVFLSLPGSLAGDYTNLSLKVDLWPTGWERFEVYVCWAIPYSKAGSYPLLKSGKRPQEVQNRAPKFDPIQDEPRERAFRDPAQSSSGRPKVDLTWDCI